MPGSAAAAQSTVTCRPGARFSATAKGSAAVPPAAPSAALGEEMERTISRISTEKRSSALSPSPSVATSV